MVNIRKRCSRATKSQDMFGHPVLLNFNQQGETHTTLVGGLVSIIIKGFILWFLCFKTYRLINHQENKISTTVGTTNVTALGSLQMEDMEIVPWIQFHSMETTWPIVLDPEEYSKFITITTDLLETTEGHFSWKAFQSRHCTKNDFGDQ